MYCNRNNYKQGKMFRDMSLQIIKSKSRAVKVLFRKLIDVLLGIHKQEPTCSTLLGDFDAKLSKICPSDKDKVTET